VTPAPNKSLRALGFGAALAASLLTLTGCGLLDWGAQFAPTPAPYSPHQSPSAIAPTPSPTPTPSPSSVPMKATGSLMLHANPVTEKLTGTCTLGEPATIVLADHQNDFFTTVDMTVVISPASLEVVSVAVLLGEDAEEGTHDMSFSSEVPIAGTSAALTGSGPDYRVTGVVQDRETRHNKTTTTLIPFTINANCKSS